MVIEKINIEESVGKVKQLLKKEKEISASLRAAIEVVLLVVSLLANRLNLNSSNSSIPPSKDPNRARKPRKDKGQKKKPGGQKGHEGQTLEKVKKPDEIENIQIDRRTLPDGVYKEVGFESRQVFDINVSLYVKEFRAEILEDERGKQYIAEFPEGVTKAVQYGPSVKSTSVQLSQFQLIPLLRVKEHFEDQLGLRVSKGSIYNFNKEAYERLEDFEKWAKEQLLKAPLNHADETGININGKTVWLHSLSNDIVTLYHADEKRGAEAMTRMGVLPFYTGILCHDHWKPYFTFDKCLHALCNAHHLRELERALEQDGQNWARNMAKLLKEINEAVDEAGGALSDKEIKSYKKRYRAILTKGEKECPIEQVEVKTRGRQKKSKSRNLLERLQNFENEVLRFMSIQIVPFTNNLAENDLRMTKVQQKISGCFRSMEGAKIFARVRSFLSTAKKNGVSSTEALRQLFAGELPDFIT